MAIQIIKMIAKTKTTINKAYHNWKSPTPAKWKQIGLIIIASAATLGSIIANVPSRWIDPEQKIFILELIGFITTLLKIFTETRVESTEQ